MNDAPLLNWKEPVIFMKRDSEGKMVARYVTKKTLAPFWFRTELADLSMPFLKVSLLLILLVTVGFLMSATQFTLGGVVAILGGIIWRFFIPLIPKWGADFRALSNVDPIRVSIWQKGVILETEDEKIHWNYADIIRAKVGTKRFGETELKQLRLKIIKRGWYPIMIAQEIEISELADLLREQGVRVSGPIERLDAGLAA